MLLVLFYPHCNGNLDCAVETWPHFHIIIQKQRILLCVVGRRPTHWRSAFQNAADEFEDCVNILQSDYHSWFFSRLDKLLWWMQCTTGKKTGLSDATFTKVGCLVVKKAYHSKCFAICLHDLSCQESERQTDRQTDRPLSLYLLPDIVPRSLHFVKIIWDSRLQTLNAFHKHVAMFILVMVSCSPWNWRF
jgi:hypothetical protein